MNDDDENVGWERIALFFLSFLTTNADDVTRIRMIQKTFLLQGQGQEKRNGRDYYSTSGLGLEWNVLQ